MKSEVILLDRGIFLRECQKNTEVQNNYRQIHTMTEKIDGANLLLSLIIAILDILMHFRCNLGRNTLFNLFLHSLSIYPCERILICPGMTIIAYIDKRLCAWCSTRTCFAF